MRVKKMRGKREECGIEIVKRKETAQQEVRSWRGNIRPW
jgi:hypothetical protein